MFIPLQILYCDRWFSFRSLPDYSCVYLIDILGKHKYFMTCLVFVVRMSDKLSHKLNTIVYMSEQKLLFSL